jgi:hypothetical protein
MPVSPIPGGNTRAYGQISSTPVAAPIEILRSMSLNTRISGLASVAPNTAQINPGHALIRDGGTGQWRPVAIATPQVEVGELVSANYVYPANEQQVCDCYLTGIFKLSELNRWYTNAQLVIALPGAVIHANLDAVIFLGGVGA